MRWLRSLSQEALSALVRASYHGRDYYCVKESEFSAGNEKYKVVWRAILRPGAVQTPVTIRGVDHPLPGPHELEVIRIFKPGDSYPVGFREIHGDYVCYAGCSKTWH
jgi:hypothetical protein